MLEILKKIYPFIKPFWKTALFSSLLAIPLALIKSYEAYFIKDVFDKGFAPDASASDAYYLAAILLGLASLNYPIRYFHYFGMRMVVDQATCLIRLRIYEKLQRLKASTFENSKQGEFLSIMINDTAIFAEAFMHSLDVIREPFTAFCLFCVALYHDWQLTLVLFIMIPLFGMIFNITGKKIRKNITLAQQDTAEMTHHVQEGLSGQKIIKAFQLQNFMIKRFLKAQEQFLIHKRKSNQAEEHSHPSVELVGAICFAIIIVYAHYKISEKALTTGSFVSFIAALAMFMDPIRKFSKSNVKLNQARAAGARIFSLLALPEEQDSSPRQAVEFKNQIQIKNLNFSYGEKAILKDVSFSIKKGQKVALVGLSGSGKSTLLSLLLGNYPVESGEIIIDQKNINLMKLAELRSYFSLVSQDIFLFNDTVTENLLMDFKQQDNQLQKALTVSHALNFINELPQGLQTVIGDRGLKLSGGQAQRLTIARAYLKDSPIYLFDEATSALDNESEKIVQAALDEVGGDKTVIAVAHRLSSISHYDQIIVLKDGKIIETGTHQELMQNQNEYFKLYQMSSIT